MQLNLDANNTFQQLIEERIKPEMSLVQHKVTQLKELALWIRANGTAEVSQMKAQSRTTTGNEFILEPNSLKSSHLSIHFLVIKFTKSEKFRHWFEIFLFSFFSK